MRHSQAAIRARETLPRALPEVKVFPSDQPCQALAFIRPPGSSLPPLARLRDQVREMRRGLIGSGAHQRELLVILFDGPPKAHGLDHPAALPLVASAPGTLASHAARRVVDAPVPGGAVRAVEIWWGGEAQRIALDMLEALPLSLLWVMPDVTLHPGLRPEPAARRADPVEDRPVAEPGAVLVPVRAEPDARLAELAAGRQADPFSDLKESLGRRRSFPGWARGGLALLPAMGSLMRFGLYAVGLMMLLAAILQGVSIGLVVFVYILAEFLGGLLSGGKDKADVAVRQPSTPGLLDNVLGWLAWKNPFGSLTRQLEARAQQVKALAARGMIDDALRLAIRLSGGQGERKLPRRYPRQLPAARARLDFDLGGDAFEAPVLPQDLSWQMRQTYEELATQLESEGDMKRAAYIRSQLLAQHDAAVRLLERGDMMEEAIRLALGAKVDPVLTIRLLYTSGKHEAAMALAHRSGCFEQLAAQSRKGDAEYHAFVLRGWTDTLVASGQPLRALQVTDDLARQNGADRALLDLRRGWLAETMKSNEPGNFAPEPLARTLLCHAPGDPGQLAGFPRALPHVGDPLLADALADLRSLLLCEGEGEALLALLAAMRRLAARRSDEQTGFWDGSGPALLEGLANTVLRQASAQLSPQDVDQLVHLLHESGHKVLARDLGTLRKLFRAAPSARRHWLVPAPLVSTSPVLVACVLGTGLIVAWRDNQQLELIDANGLVIWRQAMSDVFALVAVGGGAHALILQREKDGLTRITRFDTARRALHPVGRVNLLAHHDVTSELAWLVQLGSEIGTLDLAALCAATPRIVFLWSCALTDRLRAVAFLHEEDASSWITIDVSPDRQGLTEWWRLQGRGHLTTAICHGYRQGQPADAGELLPAVTWAWGSQTVGRTFSALTDQTIIMAYSLWSEDGETRARKLMQPRAEAGVFDQFMPCDFNRPVWIAPDPDAPVDGKLVTVIQTDGQDKREFSLHHDAQTRLIPLARVPARAHARAASGGTVLFADQFGRLFLVDPHLARVTQF